MRWSGFRRSENVEDYSDPVKPVENRPWWAQAISDVLSLWKSPLAHDAGTDDIDWRG